MSVAIYLLGIVVAALSSILGVLAFAGVASDRAQAGFGDGVDENTDDIARNPEA